MLEENTKKLWNKIEQQQQTIKELSTLLHKMDEYLAYGHGTNIGCGSIFHQQMKALAAQHLKYK